MLLLLLLLLTLRITATKETTQKTVLRARWRILGGTLRRAPRQAIEQASPQLVGIRVIGGLQIWGRLGSDQVQATNGQERREQG